MDWKIDNPPLLTKGLCVDKYGEMGVGTYTEYGWVFPFYFGKVIAWAELPRFDKENIIEREK